MLRIELFPDLSHCVEAVARKEYEEALKRLLTQGEMTEELEERAEILRLFLESADFRKLRADSEKHLLESKRVKFVVYLEYGIAKYEMSVSPEP